jgi:hypothetical protein
MGMRRIGTSGYRPVAHARPRTNLPGEISAGKDRMTGPVMTSTILALE